MKTYKSFKQHLSEQLQLDEAFPLIPVAVAIAALMVGGGAGFGLSRMFGGVGDFWRQLPEKTPAIAAILSAAGVSAYATKQFFDYLERMKGSRTVRISRKRDQEQVIIDALDFAGIPEDLMVKEPK